METYAARRDPDNTLPPQAGLIVQLVRRSPSGMTRENLIGQLKLAAQTGVLKTAQPPARILAFYKPILVKRGWLEVSGVEEPKVKADKSPVEKAAKEEKPRVTDLHLRLSDCSGKVTASDEVTRFKVHRVFKAGDQLLVLAGHDLDDHMIWAVWDGRAVLVGTLVKAAFNEACRAKELVLKLPQFDWTNKDAVLPDIVRSALGWTDSPRPAVRTTNAALPDGELAGIY